MAADLNLGIEVIGHHIVRDSDGLAKSSRNVRLSTTEREAAVCVPRSLDAACSTARQTNSADEIVQAALSVIAGEALATHEYTTVFDATTLEEVTSIASAQREQGSVRIATAVWLGDVRLIDNRDLFAPE
jgi:pantoate--beta-alanine ligase